MAIAMAGDLMAAFHDGAHDFWMALGYPAQSEERALHPGFSENLQHRMGAAFHPGFTSLPNLAIIGIGKRLDLKIIFHIHRQGVDDGGRIRRGHHGGCQKRLVIAA